MSFGGGDEEDGLQVEKVKGSIVSESVDTFEYHSIQLNEHGHEQAHV